MIPYPNIDPVAIELGPLKVHWYGLMYLGGILAAWVLTRRRMQSGRYPGWNDEQLADLTFYIALGVILGGRVGSILFYNFAEFIRDPVMLLRIWEGGMSFHGGLIGVLLACWLFSRKSAHDFWELVEIAAPVVPIGLGLGRLGNFINGELWGKVTTVPWAMVYNGQARHPTMLYEFLLEGVVLFGFLYWYTRKPRPRGHTAAWFAVLYGGFRTAVEFLRLPDAHIGYLAFDWLTMGQVLSVPMILIGLYLGFVYPRRHRETPLYT